MALGKPWKNLEHTRAVPHPVFGGAGVTAEIKVLAHRQIREDTATFRHVDEAALDDRRRLFVLDGRALEKDRAGSILFEGAAIEHEKPAAIVKRGLIHVPEGRRIFPNLSVRENLDLGSYARAAKNRVRNRARVFEIFPRLAERHRQLAGTLSGGEQQMLAIGRGLMAEPRLIILDEPSLGLSPLLVEELFALIARINGDGVSVLLVEQNVVQSLEVADRAYILAEGHFVMSGKAADIAADPALKRTYLGM